MSTLRSFSGIKSSALRRFATSSLHTPIFEASRISAEGAAGAVGTALATNEVREGEGEAKKEVRKRILSGVQPTGTVHLGNYLGAIKNWESLQRDYDSFFMVVDLHAITVPHEPKDLERSTLTAAALYLACGIDPSCSTIFVQSHVRAHAELTWLLNCVTPLTWLERMIQFKEKARKQGEEVGVGLLDYPVLMAADILLYQSDLVPVGEDQRQHLELTRDIAERFNRLYCKRKVRPVFRVPNAYIAKDQGARVMSLTDGTSKMSKSAPSDLSRINLLDSPDLIRSKIKKCKTDATKGLEFDNPQRPECNNLLTIYQLLSSKTKEEVQAEVADMGWGEFKPLLTECVVEYVRPIQQRFEQIMSEKGYLKDVLRTGKHSAEQTADRTLDAAFDALGFARASRVLAHD